MRATRHLALSVGLLGVGLFVVGCGDSSSPSLEPGVGIDTGTASDAGARQDTGTGGETGNPSSDAGSDSGGKPFEGSFGALQNSPFGMSYYAIGGDFFTPLPAQTACMGGTMSGACCYVPAASADAGAPHGPDVSAGTLTVKDGSTTIATLMPWMGFYQDNSTIDMMVKWTPGDTLGFSASGDAMGAGAFSGTVTAVELVAGEMPVIGQNTVMISSPFTETWAPGSVAGAKMNLLLDGGANGTITCSVDDSAGTVTVDATLRANIPAGTTGSMTLMRLLRNPASTQAPNASVFLFSMTTLGQLAQFQ